VSCLWAVEEKESERDVDRNEKERGTGEEKKEAGSFLVFFEKSEESLRVSLREKVENDLDKIFLFSPSLNLSPRTQKDENAHERRSDRLIHPHEKLHKSEREKITETEEDEEDISSA
jgi:hypothetical protein